MRLEFAAPGTVKKYFCPLSITRFKKCVLAQAKVGWKVVFTATGKGIIMTAELVIEHFMRFSGSAGDVGVYEGWSF